MRWKANRMTFLRHNFFFVAKLGSFFPLFLFIVVLSSMQLAYITSHYTTLFFPPAASAVAVFLNAILVFDVVIQASVCAPLLLSCFEPFLTYFFVYAFFFVLVSVAASCRGIVLFTSVFPFSKSPFFSCYTFCFLLEHHINQGLYLSPSFFFRFVLELMLKSEKKIHMSTSFFFFACVPSFYTRDSVTTIPLFRLLKLLLLYEVLVTVSRDDDPPCFSFFPFLQFFKKKKVASFCSHCCQKKKN